MNFNTTQFTTVVEQALAHTDSVKWQKAIERAAEGLKSGVLVVSELASGALVTTENGSYRVNGECQCTAFKYGHKECKHRAARRLCALYSAAIIVERAEVTRIETRTVEFDRNGTSYPVVRYDGWCV